MPICNPGTGNWDEGAKAHRNLRGRFPKNSAQSGTYASPSLGGMVFISRIQPAISRLYRRLSLREMAYFSALIESYKI